MRFACGLSLIWIWVCRGGRLHSVSKTKRRGRVYHERRKENNYGKVQKIRQDITPEKGAAEESGDGVAVSWENCYD